MAQYTYTIDIYNKNRFVRSFQEELECNQVVLIEDHPSPYVRIDGFSRVQGSGETIAFATETDKTGHTLGKELRAKENLEGKAESLLGEGEERK
jgi:hypothetical protein